MELKIGKLYQLGYPMRLNTCHPLDGDMKFIDVLQISSLVVLLDTLDTKYESYVKLLSSQGFLKDNVVHHNSSSIKNMCTDLCGAIKYSTP